jgi:hypothetical protein
MMVPRHCESLQIGTVLFNRLQGSKTAARVWDCCVHTGESLSPSGETIAEVSAALSQLSTLNYQLSTILRYEDY